jgi:uncharacterized Zn-binding protein involved in type VI secretion
MRIDPFSRASRVAPWALGLLLAACQQGSDEMSWARSALERNADLEIVAEDADARTFTVRNRKSGALEIVPVDQISATPSAGAASVPVAPADSAATASAAPIDRGEAASAGDSATAPAAQTDEAAQPPVDENEPAARVGDEVMEPRAANGQVIASGKGYSIERSTQPAPATAQRGTEQSGPVERRYEPLVCQGARMLHIDGRNISFEGDAIRAEEGCELHITNSRISAAGVGLAARNANVHINNSTVSGQGGAIQASGNTQIYARSSRFSGMVRRIDGAVLHDQGDNVWN